MNEKKSWWQGLFGSKSTEDDSVLSGKLRAAYERMAEIMNEDVHMHKGDDFSKLIAGLIVSRATAMDEVLIHSQSLKPAFYKDVLRGLKCPARILLDDPTGLMVIKYLPQEIQDRISVRILSSSQPYSDKKYFIATDYAFRCGVRLPDNELVAAACFNDPPRAQRWKASFEVLWEKASSVSIAKVILS